MKSCFFQILLLCISALSCKSGSSGGGSNPAPTAIPAIQPVYTQPPVDPNAGTPGGANPGTIAGTPPPGTPGVSGTVDYTYILADDIKTQCASQNKMVDRAGRKCKDGSTLDTSKPCTTDSVNTSFAASGAAAIQKINELQGQGYTLDQCGTISGKAAASLYRTYSDASGGHIATQFLQPN